MMKLNKYSWLAILPMIFSACQDDTLVENQQRNNKVYTLTANMEDGAAMSRAQIQLGKTSPGEELFFWNQNDQFDLYLTENTEPNVFTIADDYSEPYSGEQKTATFTTTTPVPIDEDYVAVYPSGVSMEDGSFEFSINNHLEFYPWSDSQVIWASYLKQNMYMVADGKFEDPTDASVSFNHLCALIRVTYSNQTGEKQTINYLNISGVSQQFSSVYRYAMDGTASTEPGSSYSLYTHELTVQPNETTDFYVLFFPEKFSEEEDEYLRFEIQKQNGDLGFVNIDLEAIKEANSQDDGFKAGKRYWFKVTETENSLTWTNYTKMVEVDDFAGFKEAMTSQTVTHVVLKNPIVIDEGLNIESGIHKTILPSEDSFTWMVDNVEQDALIINESGSSIYMFNCTVQGTAEETDGEKYLMKVTSGDFAFRNFELDANGAMNGMKVENSKLYMYEGTSINVENDNNAVYVWSKDKSSTINIQTDATVEGNVSCVSDYDGNSSFYFENGKLDGEITVSGDYISNFAISLDENSVYTGTRIAEVSTWKGFHDLVNNGAITDIKLTNPIIIPTDGDVDQVFNLVRTISMSDDFVWTVDGEEYDALIVSQAEKFDFGNCTLVGTTNLPSKYLLRVDTGEFFPSYVKLDANGTMNGMKLADVQSVYMSEKLSVDVESDDSYALYITADKVPSRVNLSIEGEINGNVYFENNYDSEESPWSMLQIGINDKPLTLNGEVITAGNNIQDLRVHLYGVFNGSKTIEADDIQDILNVQYNETVDTIVLKNPILVTEKVHYAPTDYSPKFFLMDESFTWFVGGEEYDALFVNSGEWLYLSYCTVQGSCADTKSDKYMLETTTGNLFLSDGTLDAGGGMNGVRVKDSSFSLLGEDSSIVVESENRLALDISSSADEVAAGVHIQGTVNGDVTYVGNNSSSNKSDSFSVSYGGKIYGDLNASYKYCRVTYEDSSVVEGDGWASFVTPSN